MEIWWFLEPLAYTSFISLAFSAFIAFLLDAILDFDNDSHIPVYIILIGAIPCAIFLVLGVLWFVSFVLYKIWAPYF